MIDGLRHDAKQTWGNHWNFQKVSKSFIRRIPIKKAVVVPFLDPFQLFQLQRRRTVKFRQWLGKLVSAKSFGPGVDLEGADCEDGGTV